jgi:nucleoid DNA-binding protein
MTKADIVNNVSKSTGFTKVEVEIVLDSIMNSIKTSLSNGERVDMRGFGSFIVKRREARSTRNPATNEIVNLDTRYIPSFKVSKILKEFVNNNLIN